MELNRPQVDVGLFTNRINEMKAFYGETLGLQFESELAVGGGFKQHRFIASGSIIQIDGFARSAAAASSGGLRDPDDRIEPGFATGGAERPDGNTIELVPPGRNDVTQLEVRLGVSDVNRFDTFYTKTAEATGIGDHRYKIGETIFATFRHPLAREVKPAPMANLLEVVKAMAALGIRYVTIQVKNCDAAFKAMTAAGAAVGVAPETFGNVARAAFVRDPDGNFIELALRPL